MEPLYTTHVICTEEEYFKFQKEIFRHYAANTFSIVLVYVLFLAYFLYSCLLVHKAQAVTMLLAMVLFPFVLNRWRRYAVSKTWKTNKVLQNLESELRFFPDYLEAVDQTGITKLPYDQLFKIYETAGNFYLMLAKNQGIIVVKQNCSAQLLDFLRNLKQRGSL